MRLALDQKFRNEFIKFYIGNEINPNLKIFRHKFFMKQFSKNKDQFKNIRDRLVEISHKLGISVTDFKRLVSRVQKEKKSQELQKKKWLKLTYV